MIAGRRHYGGRRASHKIPVELDVGAAGGALHTHRDGLAYDSEAHERAIGIKQREEFFNLSVTSHMATVAFDKHAAFCEDYVARVNKGVGELFRDGPSKNAMSIVQDLASIRQKHAPWVPADVLNGLKPFEEALWKVGINAGYVADVGDAHDRGDRIDEMYKIFSQVLGQPWQGTEQRSEVRIEQVLVYIQGVLGIEELHELRTTVVRRAIEGIRDA